MSEAYSLAYISTPSPAPWPGDAWAIGDCEYTKLEELESYFSQNKVVCDHKRFWGRNQHIDRFHRMILINQLLSMPKTHIKRGEVTEAELASITLSLKRWALWPYTFGTIWFVAAIIWYLWYDW